MKVFVNTSNVTVKLDEAFATEGHYLDELRRELWKGNAARAAADVQAHPDNARLMTPPEFEVEVSEHGFFVTPLSGSWAATHVVEPGTLGTHV